MLHLCHNHLIVFLHLTFAERRSHEINRLCGASCEHDLLNLPSIDKPTHLLTCRLMQIRRLLTQIMHPTMHIGIHIDILIPHRIQHTQRFLRCCSIVEIYQRLLINLSQQNGEILPYLIDIVHSISFLSLYIFPGIDTGYNGTADIMPYAKHSTRDDRHRISSEMKRGQTGGQT